jgi:hypothetical protein
MSGGKKNALRRLGETGEFLEELSLHFSPNLLTHAEFEDFFGAADRLSRPRTCRL